MAYTFKTLAVDNSAVNTRQVRRQRERLAAKPGIRGPAKRDDAPPARLMVRRFSSSKYMPHIGAKERARHG